MPFAAQYKFLSADIYSWALGAVVARLHGMQEAAGSNKLCGFAAKARESRRVHTYFSRRDVQ